MDQQQTNYLVKRIGIFGGGVLGTAMKQYFTKAKIYDKYNQQDSLAEVLKQELLFICVPTPHTQGQGFDLTEMDDVFEKISQVKDKIVVIRSTVIPGTTKNYQEKYPQHKILFNPEFLTEATAVEDFLHPDKQIIGYTEKSQEIAEKILQLLPDATFKKIIRSAEAEMIKYMINCFYATKVIFANQMYDLCQAAGIDYEIVKQGLAADKRIGSSHLEIFHKGYRGYGGKCLRKDVDCLIDFAEDYKVKLELLAVIKEINLKLNNGK